MENTSSQSAIEINFDTLLDEGERTAWVKFREGFELELKFMPRAEMQRMIETATVRKYNDDAKARVPTLDADRLVDQYCDKVVRDWRVTPRAISTLYPIKTESLSKEDLDKPIKFSIPQMKKLTKKCYDLDIFIQQSCVDAKLFNIVDEEAEKNSGASQSGS